MNLKREKTVSDQAVLFETIGDHIALLTINRPEARNAVNADVVNGIDRALKETESDDQIWAVILTGAGDKAFCAGADLKAVAAGETASLMTKEGGFGALTRAHRTKLWIAAINGSALAGGCELALACDLIVASQHAVFGVPEVKRGLAALAGGIFRLPRALPKAIALELIATGGVLDAERALRFGLVNRLTREGEALTGAIEFAETISANAPLAVRESLAVARQSYDLDEDALWALNDAAAVRIMKSEDFKEGPRAFVEKRSPQWKGR
ncbi:MAG: crotonase/enoyl-CoA hydratase family protein [Pseudomonadota bacterium]